MPFIWLVQAWAATGRIAVAHALFTELGALASPLGLYDEEMDTRPPPPPRLPQALAHAALLQAALSLCGS